jgi:hypothetical protein
MSAGVGRILFGVVVAMALGSFAEGADALPAVPGSGSATSVMQRVHGWHCGPAWDPYRGWHRHYEACRPYPGRPPGWGPRPPGWGYYRCPPGGYVNCMPPVRYEARRWCSPDFIRWARRNCPGFEPVY